MGSLAMASPHTADVPPATAAGASPAQIPELSDADYEAEVLRLESDRREADIDGELAAKAAALGISDKAEGGGEKGGEGLEAPGAQSAAAATPKSHARHVSGTTDGSASTAPTAQSAAEDAAGADAKEAGLLTKTRSKSLSFSQYDRYLAQADRPPAQSKHPGHPAAAARERAPGAALAGRRRSYAGIKNGFRARLGLRRSSTASLGATLSCVCCRDEFAKAHEVQALPCGHAYCNGCLRVMLNNAVADESLMPPRCCTQPVPGATVRAVLAREEQHAFLKAVQQFSTPWQARIFCPRKNCNEFIPPRGRVDPKHPFAVVCAKCRARVCVMCKGHAHEAGQECPADWALDAVLRMGEKSGWRRCYKCRALVELTQGCTHMTCRCKAQFCYICGAVWEPSVGCPNYCNGEEVMEERRQALEAEAKAQEEAAAAAEAGRREAARRTAESAELAALRARRDGEVRRFRAFEAGARAALWARHNRAKEALAGRYADQADKMRERHAKTAQHLEDRQVAAEMEFRETLEQSERSVRIRIRHMEAYCDSGRRGSSGSGSGSGASRSPDGGMPPRVVTERDLRELSQQYSLRDDMQRLHQAKINVLRDQQTKQMEELVERQGTELARLAARREAELEELAARSAAEEDAVARRFADRRARLEGRWRLAGEVLRTELERRDGVPYGAPEAPAWPAETGPEGAADSG